MKVVGDETLMAYADGMLPHAEVKEVERFIADDPVAAAKVEKYRQSALLVKSLGASLGNLEVSPELRRRVGAMSIQSAPPKDNVVSFPTRAANQNKAQPRMLQAMVGAIALFSVGLWSGLQYSSQNNAQLVAVGATLPDDVLAVLTKLPSGESQNASSGKVRLLASFQLEDGNVCREFELSPHSGTVATLAIACKTAGSNFATRMALATSSLAKGYAPASANETIDAYLASIGAGSPLSTQDELKVLQK